MFLKAMLSRPLKLFVCGLVVCLVLVGGNGDNNLVNAKPSTINAWPECPPQSNTVWVKLDENHSPTRAQNVVQIPFDSGTVDIGGYTYDNYIRGVLAGEVSTTTEPDGMPVVFDEETLKAMAVAVRTKVYQSCGGEPNDYFQDNNGTWRRGIRGQVIQDYQYNKALVQYTEAERQRYQQAINATTGEYLTYGSDTFDIFYRSIGGQNTQDLEPDGPHKGIYDPAGKFHAGFEIPGLPQMNANHWATGQNHDETLPIWDYRSILIHYYTGVHVRDASGTRLTPDNRWNPLTINWGTPDNRPPVIVLGGSYPVIAQIQNTGVFAWVVDGQYWELAYHWAKVGYGEINSGNRARIDGAIPRGGVSPNLLLTINDRPNWGRGIYTLKFDMVLRASGGTYWFRDWGWPTYNVEVYGEYPVFLPVVLNGGAAAGSMDSTK